MTEHAEACALMKVCRLHEKRHPSLARIIHVPNGGKRSRITSQHLKAEGVKAGVPDYLLLEPRGEYSGLAVELKRGEGGSTSAAQLDWLAYLKSVGWRASVCEGWEAAWVEVLAYVQLPAKESREAA